MSEHNRKSFLNQILTLAAAAESQDSEDRDKNASRRASNRIGAIPRGDEPIQKELAQSRDSNTSMAEIKTSNNYVVNYLSQLILNVSSSESDSVGSKTQYSLETGDLSIRNVRESPSDEKTNYTDDSYSINRSIYNDFGHQNQHMQNLQDENKSQDKMIERYLDRNLDTTARAPT